MAGFCRIWVPNYRLRVKSLNEALKKTGSGISYLDWRMPSSFWHNLGQVNFSPSFRVISLADQPICLQETKHKSWHVEPHLGNIPWLVAYFCGQLDHTVSDGPLALGRCSYLHRNPPWGSLPPWIAGTTSAPYWERRETVGIRQEEWESIKPSF